MSAVSDLRSVVAAELADVHTCLPGVIVSYDGQMATVRPAIAKQLTSGESLPAPQIVSVPMCWPCGDVGGGQALISVPLRAGDPVLLHFSERAIEDWLNGADGPPGDPRQFDLSDAFATPMMRPGTMLAADLDTLTMRYGAGAIRISLEGRISFVAPLGVDIDSPLTTLTGGLNILGTTTGNGVNLNTHTHSGVESGPGSSGPPIPGT